MTKGALATVLAGYLCIRIRHRQNMQSGIKHKSSVRPRHNYPTGFQIFDAQQMRVHIRFKFESKWSMIALQLNTIVVHAHGGVSGSPSRMCYYALTIYK